MSDAKRDQAGHGGDYTGDEWHKVELQPGTRLYQLDRIEIDENGDEVIVGSKYFIDDEQMREGDYVTYETVVDEDGNEQLVAHFDAEKYADDMQIKPYISEDGKASYCDHVSVFEVPEGVTIEAEEGVTDANFGYGHGGERQIFISESEQEKLRIVDEEIVVDQPDLYVDAARQMQDHGREIASMDNVSLDEDDETEFADAVRETNEKDEEPSGNIDADDSNDRADR